MACHDADERRPEHGLEKSVAAPKCGHDIGIGEERQDEVAGSRAEQTEGDHAAGLDPIAEPTADELSDTIGNKAAGNSHAGERLGQFQCGDELAHNGAVVHTGDVTGKVNKTAKVKVTVSDKQVLEPWVMTGYYSATKINNKKVDKECYLL